MFLLLVCAAIAMSIITPFLVMIMWWDLVRQIRNVDKRLDEWEYQDDHAPDDGGGEEIPETNVINFPERAA